MTREEIKKLALQEQTYHIVYDNNIWVDAFIHAFELAEKHERFVKDDKGIELIDAIKGFCGLTGEQVYPVESFMCLGGYVENWECVDDIFYINGKQVAP